MTNEIGGKTKLITHIPQYTIHIPRYPALIIKKMKGLNNIIVALILKGP